MSGVGSAGDQDRQNPFWAAVCGGRSVVADRSIAAGSLQEAARASFRTAPSRFGFRRPSELVDLEGRFRLFTFRGRSYVGKRCTRADAVREAWHARRAAAVLAAAPGLDPVVPIVVRDDDSNARILVTEDVGDSLASGSHGTSAVLPWDQLVETIGTMLEVGIVWSGFLPRNVLPRADGGLALIDWEDCQFHRPAGHVRAAGDLILLFWSIGWSHHYGVDAERFQEMLVGALDLTVVEDPLDQFELAYASMLPPGVGTAEIRRRCSEATIATEAGHPLLPAVVDPRRMPGPLSPAEVGHLLDELLPQHLSVLYTFGCRALLDDRDVARYLHAVELVNRALVLGTPCEGLRTATERHRLQLLVLLVLVAAVLDEVDPDVGVTASDLQDLGKKLCDRSILAAQICPESLGGHPRPAGAPSVTAEAMSRFLSLAAHRLGVPGGPFHVHHSDDGVAVYDDRGAPAAAGVRSLLQQVVEMVSVPAEPSHRRTVKAVGGT